MQERHPVRAPRQRGLVIPYSALAGALTVLAVAGVAILILWQTDVIFSSSKNSVATTGPTPAIHFRYPKSWTVLPKSQWSTVGAPSTASAVLQRKGNSANLVVIPAGKAEINGSTVQRINDQLSKRYSDYKFVGAHRIQLPNIADQGLLFTYGRAKQGVLHTLTIIPAPPSSFIIETASPPKNKPIERQIVEILKSASVTYPSK